MKKALISKSEFCGKDNANYRVVQVVDANNTFDVHSNLEWKDCEDNIEADKWSYDPATSTFKVLPYGVDPSTAGTLTHDDNGVPTEKYVWDWDTETWNKEAL